MSSYGLAPTFGDRGVAGRIGGTDVHAKKYFLLLAGSDVALAPLYDVASALPYSGGSVHKLGLAMKYGADYTLGERTPSMWAAVAGEFGLPEEEVRVRTRELGSLVPDALRDASTTDDVRELDSGLPAALVDAVTRRVAACLSTLR
jgi:serine/threonine-protein kinase HipA